MNVEIKFGSPDSLWPMTRSAAMVALIQQPQVEILGCVGFKKDGLCLLAKRNPYFCVCEDRVCLRVVALYLKEKEA